MMIKLTAVFILAALSGVVDCGNNNPGCSKDDSYDPPRTDFNQNMIANETWYGKLSSDNSSSTVCHILKVTSTGPYTIHVEVSYYAPQVNDRQCLALDMTGQNGTYSGEGVVKAKNCSEAYPPIEVTIEVLQACKGKCVNIRLVMITSPNSDRNGQMMVFTSQKYRSKGIIKPCEDWMKEKNGNPDLFPIYNKSCKLLNPKSN